MPWDLEAREWLDTLVQLQAQHFTTGVPPEPPMPPLLLTSERTAAADTTPWHYRTNYLEGLAAQKQTADAARPAGTGEGGNSGHGNQATRPGLSLAFLAAHQPALSAHAGTRSLLLSGIVRLRSHPLLRGVAQRIPQRWQTQVKSWLRA